MIKSESKNETDIPISINIEKIRVEASNKLRLIKEQIESIENIDSNYLTKFFTLLLFCGIYRFKF